MHYMKKKDQILLEEAYQKVVEGSLDYQPGDMRSAEQRKRDWTRHSLGKRPLEPTPPRTWKNDWMWAGSFNPQDLSNIVLDFYTGKSHNPKISRFDIETYFVPDKPDNYGKMKDIISNISKHMGRKPPELDDKTLNVVAKLVQTNIEKNYSERREKESERINTEISKFDGEKRNETIKKLQDAGYKELQGDEYKDYDQSGKRILNKYFSKTIGGLFRGRSKEEDIVRVNPNGSVNDYGISVDEYFKQPKGRQFSQSKKSFF